MKNKTSFFVNCILTVALISGLLWCCITSFSIEANPAVLITSTVLFTGLFALVSEYIERRGKFLFSLLIIVIVFLIAMLVSFNLVLASANYTVNCILSSYSEFMSIPSKVTFSEIKGLDANAFFVAISFVLSLAFATSLIRLKRIIIIIALSVLCLVPNFVLVTTLPSLIPLMIVVAILFALYVTTFIRRNNQSQNGVMLIISTAVMLVSAIIICIFIPVENYERENWQTDLLDYAQALTGIESGHKSSAKSSDETTGKQTFIQEEKLDEIGPFKQKGTKVLEYYSNDDGYVYLRAVAYGNYNNNEWSMLTDEQLDALPSDYNLFSITSAENLSGVSIKTENVEDVIYTPYYYSYCETENEFSYIGDVYINNDSNMKDYIIAYYSNISEESFDAINSEELSEYRNFIYDNYTLLPDDVKEKMIEIGTANGIGIPQNENGELDYETKMNIVNEVKNFVSNHGSYSLNTPKIPEGKELPVWFLEESDTGYCVHYATAAAVMLRAYGIPARYVTGFYTESVSGEWTEVSSDNAHAWVEYFDENIGWVPLEATPASFVPSGSYADLSTDTLPPTKPQTTTIADTTTQPLTTTEPATTLETQASSSATANSRKTSLGVVDIIILIVLLIIAVILSVIARRDIVLRRRKRNFTTGKNNSRAIYIFRYIESLDKFSNNVIPDEIIEIAQKAKFSRHSVENSEVKILLAYAVDAKKELLNNSSFIRKLYLKYFIVI
ncbi:MAG: transglutaminase domain-containing protein [Ruminococcus sp.]|nr:transglutaminase domain-containing protein [Ruminococcus sp.]